MLSNITADIMAMIGTIKVKVVRKDMTVNINPTVVAVYFFGINSYI